ncbi:ribosome-associated translation inhibitor RaiA [Pullulanibacillus sp. KACC 23026]|uniref:ribosome hibernation-promoting factor, HPF/YfiA family n=1 Tax=Pullulanibacillus sp. KACC 23026 TaxID=3028315 RepID=UPI0023B1DC65|nr:ribosome-associated translation inhibitor RaiA [Pullulanibacillus sp. KACC 23026]WEG13596.1 ribosome-associated translation inhibitor RaiA [Pullulanibacillus sp. KACC 23026]
MNFNIRGENLKVTPALRNYTEKKISKLGRYFDTPLMTDVHVNMHVHNNNQVIEVTIPLQGLLLRAEESQMDMYAAIDSVIEKLERQIRKYKTKVNRKYRQRVSRGYAQIAVGANPVSYYEDDEVVEESDFDVVRRKRFNFKPMDVDEAIMQMDMLGHDFFVFSNSVTGDTSVVYRRKDGKYGLIEKE